MDNGPADSDKTTPTDVPVTTTTQKKAKMKRKDKKAEKRTRIVIEHCDIIKDEFWKARSDILGE